MASATYTKADFDAAPNGVITHTTDAGTVLTYFLAKNAKLSNYQFSVVMDGEDWLLDYNLGLADALPIASSGRSIKISYSGTNDECKLRLEEK